MAGAIVKDSLTSMMIMVGGSLSAKATDNGGLEINVSNEHAAIGASVSLTLDAQDRVRLAAVVLDDVSKVAVSSVAKAYVAGAVRALKMFAWWKDGVQFVGTSGLTLAEAIAAVEASGAEWGA